MWMSRNLSSLAWHQAKGGPRVTMWPQNVFQTRGLCVLGRCLHIIFIKTTAATLAMAMGRVRNGHSTQSSNDSVCWPMCPPQWWATQSVHSSCVSVWSGWMCNDEKSSIDRKTANNSLDAIRLRLFAGVGRYDFRLSVGVWRSILLVFAFTAAKVRKVLLIMRCY